MRALVSRIRQRGYEVELNRLSRKTKVCLFNSFNLDAERLRYLRHSNCRFVHRVDGPITVYRGYEDGSDHFIHSLNSEFADKTIFQSHYSLNKHREMGMEFANPTVIGNAVDDGIFNTLNRKPFDPSEKIRLISTSWSNNPNKGQKVYEWLDANLDFRQYSYIFVGRIQAVFKNIVVIPPVDSQGVASLLKQSDIYITASLHDPCSNALVEALAAGLPALCANSGGHPEILQRGGLLFDEPTEIPMLLDKIMNGYALFQSQIAVSDIKTQTEKYLLTLELS